MNEVLGVDLGGTKVAVARLQDQSLSESVLRPTDSSSTDALIEQIVAMIEEARGDELKGVGVGVPSVVEFETGRVVSTVNLPLADVALRDVLSERIGLPVFVDNDATVAALAEAHDHDLQMVARHLIMLTIGTGVGGGLILGGRIYRGATGGAGELGHTLIGMNCSARVPPAQKFPQPGSLEQLAAGRALDALATECADDNPDSKLGRIRASGEELLGAEVVSAAHEGDPLAMRLVERWAERVGIGVANAINTFDPEEVVIGGGAARAGDLLLGPARRVASEYVAPGLGKRTKIRLARHGVGAGVLGAALLAVHELAQSPPSSAASPASPAPTEVPG